MQNTTWLVSIFALAVTTVPSIAQEQRTGFAIGVGAAVSDDPYIGDNETVSAVPIFTYQGRGFSLGTGGAEVTLADRSTVTVEGLLKPRFSALDDPDAVELAGIDRDITLDLGVRFTYAITDTLEARATLLQEVTGEHDGQEVVLGLENSVRLGQVPVSLGIGVSWKSEDLNNYVFGVAATEAIVGRPAYDPGASFTPYLSVSTGIPLSQQTMLIGSIRADFFADEITDSPIIDDDVSVSGFLGISYRF